MAELRWIKASRFLVLVLQFTAATGQRHHSFTVRDGDEVSLPCFNVMDDHNNCDSTEWIFVHLKSPLAVYLVTEGQIVAEAKDKSDRLSVSENCSLVIKKVTDEDVGHYACIQYRSGQQQVQDAKVILSVVTMTEHKDSEEVICSLSTYRTCRLKMKWMIEEEEVEEDHQGVMTSQSSCSASLKVKTGSFNTLRFNSWMCEVTVGDQVQKFTFRNPPSGDKTGEDTTTTTTTTEDDTISAAATGQDYDSFTVRDGDEVSLPCFNVMDDHKNCDSTYWIFYDLMRTVAVFLVKEGQIDAEAKDKSDRLSVSENCSLVIKKVTDEDTGLYVCRQYRSGHQQGQYAVVDLFVVTMTEHKDSEEVICSVSTYDKPCGLKVKWLIEEEEVEEDHQDVMTSQSSCSASLKVKTGSFNTLRFNSWMCEVTVGDQVQKFTFRNPPSGDKTGEDTTTTTTTTTTEDDTISAAATGQDYDSFTVRDGDEVSLPCFNVMDDHKNCDSTEWIFYDLKSPVAVFLVKEGQIDVEAKDKSDRLSVSERCSLVIKKVTDEDVGLYNCIQFRSGHQQVQYAVVDLSVVTMTEHKDSEEVICSVSTYDKPCRHKVKWLIEEEEVEEDHQDVMTSQSSCSASLKVKTGSFNTLRFNSWMCEVTVGDQVQKFTFRNPPSGDKTGEDTTTTTTTTTEDDTISGWWRVILVPVGLAALIIIVVAVNIWARMKETSGMKLKTPKNFFCVHF
ncbi:uncharacterized protein LOC130202347 isoform X3 [Pseudoliparis swirei]|uniref:uncharacterized protein LOC130202347 isoform X3 n=1 Tax=Pseudoliparis swirei TaxID=2059687 RepID=UPI0024BE3516|nr:uncharacterized protein LOC130202347 isoform X3 [Pseudoliparis swirei]